MTNGAGTVTIRLPQALAVDVDGQRTLTFPVEHSTSLGEVLEQVARTSPTVGRRIQDETGMIRRFVNVYVGESECRTLAGLATPVSAGDVILVVPSVAGG